MNKKYIIILFLLWSSLLSIFLLQRFGFVTTSYKGFAVDENESIYIGREKYIDVYAPTGDYQKTISSVTSRGYRFNIEGDNVLRIDTGTELYEVSLNYENVKETEYRRIINKKEFYSPRGKKYQVSNSFFRPKLLLCEAGQEKIVYIMPLKDYVIKVLDICLWLLFVFNVIIIIKKRNELKRDDSFPHLAEK